MNIKRVSLLIGAVVVILVLLGGWYLKSQPYATDITGLETAKIGELVELEAIGGGSDYKWIVIPSTNNIKLINNGQSLIFSAMSEGTYTFICAMTNHGKVQLLLHTLVIGNNPNPGPGPGPGPDNTIDSLVKSWLPTGATKAVAEKLAHSLELAATSRQDDVSGLIKITSISNRAALGDDIKTWEPFLKKFSEYCKSNLQDKTLEDHVKVWLDVAAALRKVG